MAITSLPAALGNLIACDGTLGPDTVNSLGRTEFDENLVLVNKRTWSKTISPSLFTASAIVANGTVIAATEVLSNVTPAVNTNCMLKRVTMLDKGRKAFSAELWLLKANRSMGAENALRNIADTDAEDLLGRVPFYQSETDELGASYFTEKNVNVPIEPVVNTDDIYVAVVGTDFMNNPVQFVAGQLFFRLTFGSN
jgi:hypothetical protein